MAKHSAILSECQERRCNHELHKTLCSQDSNVGYPGCRVGLVVHTPCLAFIQCFCYKVSTGSIAIGLDAFNHTISTVNMTTVRKDYATFLPYDLIRKIPTISPR